MDSVVQAISDDNRRAILETLRRGPATVTELAADLTIARPGVSRHLRILREVGLVRVHKDAQRRIYALEAAPLAELDEWLEPYRALWAGRLAALHTEVARGKRQNKQKEHDDD
ncbi:MAG TPA: metalloregulator ArsR/SmtB family transcription factor [Pseudolysinimonas sp.]